MVTIMALICHAVISACGRVLSMHGDINVSKTLEDRMGHMCVCVIKKKITALFWMFSSIEMVILNIKRAEKYRLTESYTYVHFYPDHEF